MDLVDNDPLPLATTPPADRHDPLAKPLADWQILPPNLKTEDPAGFQKIRIAATLDLLKFELGDMPQQRRGAERSKMRNVVNFIDNTKNFLAYGMPAQIRSVYNHWTDNLGAQAWNVLNHFFQSKDQRVFLHMVNLFEAGAFTLPGLDKPLNQCSFEEVIAAELEEERLYWKHQQRIGTFIALTADDLKEDAWQDKTAEQLVLDDFKLARKAIDKAVLIVFEDADGTRNVLKDQTGETPLVTEAVSEAEAVAEPQA